MGFGLSSGGVIHGVCPHLFVYAKSFGLITPDDGGADLSTHFSVIQAGGFKTLQENQRVSFDVTDGSKGKQASNIQAA